MNEQTLDIHGKKYNRTLMIVVILVATFAGMLMQTSLGTMLPTLMKDFNVNMATAQTATTWFLLANGIMIPVSAYLATKIPTKRLYLIAYLLLFAGMFLTYSAPTSNYSIFIAGRMLQAVAVGITMPLMQVVMVNVFPPHKMGAVMGLSGLVVGLAPAIGPTFAGWVIDKDHVILGLTLSHSWRTVFLLPMVILGIAFVLGFFVIKDVVPNKEVKLDFISLFESILGFGLFLWGFTNVASDGWGNVPNVILPIGLGMVVIGIFARRQFTMKTPFLNLRVFKNKQFTLTTASLALVTMAMMGVEMMLPMYLQSVRGLSALDAGLVLLPGALMMGIVSPIAGRAYDRVGAKRLVGLGMVILGLGTLPFMFFGVETPEHFVTLLYGMRMFGVALGMMPLTASAMRSLPKEEIAHGTAANSTARQISSSVVVALLSSVTQNIINNHQPMESLKTLNPLQYADKMITASLDGFHVSFAIGMSFAVVGFIVIQFLQGHKTTKEVK
ncbi:MAG: multidrug efflux MFS transporter [Streptococcaceae bacterium]|jgi:EmrB/QacA subfamily drug resistance transporter|nr:multidrug efflux MFS transporter [Streptococcaceae bacterium]